jgi:hypothetical protein
MRAIALLAVTSFVAGTSLGEPCARAEDRATEEARQHFLKGQQFFDVGRWDEAADEFEKAYATRSDPVFIYNMAQSFRRKGDTKRALDLYKNYLILAPKSTQRAEVEDRIQTLQKQLDAAAEAARAAPVAEPPVVEPAPVAPPPTAAPTAPQPPPSGGVPAGPVAAPPVSAASAPAALEPTQPTDPGPAVPQPEHAAPSPDQSAAPSPVQVEDVLLPPNPGRGLRVAGVLVGAVGLASIGAGIVFGAQASSYSDSVQTRAVFDPSADKQGKRYETLQWVSFGVGGGLLVTGAVLYGVGVLSARTVRVALAPAPIPGGAALCARGMF